MRPRGARLAAAGAIMAPAVIGAAALLVRGESGGVFFAGPIVVLPLLCGVFASAVAMVVTDHCRRWFAVLAVALALTMVLMGLAAAGVWAALTGASALRPIVLGAMALVAAELVLDRGLPTVRRVVICVAVASSCAILLFQPIETSFGSWPTRRRRPPGRRRAGRNRIRIRGWEP